MKKINQYKLLAGICVLSLFTACDFEELNTNPFEMTDEMGIRDGVAVGGAVMAMQNKNPKRTKHRKSLLWLRF